MDEPEENNDARSDRNAQIRDIEDSGPQVADSHIHEIDHFSIVVAIVVVIVIELFYDMERLDRLR